MKAPSEVEERKCFQDMKTGTSGLGRMLLGTSKGREGIFINLFVLLLLKNKRMIG